MATYNTLTSLLTAIANAIRTKTGDTASINAQDFPNKIESISATSGELLINHYSNVKINTDINETVVNIQIDKGSYKLTGFAQCYSFTNRDSSSLTALLNDSTLMQISGKGDGVSDTKNFEVENTSNLTITVIANGDNNKFFCFDTVLTKTI